MPKCNKIYKVYFFNGIMNREGRSLLKKLGYISAVGILAASTITSCAAPKAQYTPYPPAGKGAIDYNRDVAECKYWARGQHGANPQRALNEGAQGAVGGAVLGAILGAILGGGRGAGIGAATGAATFGAAGSVHGSKQTQMSYNMAYLDCLNKKGY